VPNNLSLNGPKIDFVVVIQDDGKGNMLKTWYAKRAAWFPGINQWRFYDAHLIDAAVMANPPPPPAQTIPSYERLIIEEPWSETPWTILSGKINSEFLSVPELAAYLNSAVSLEEKKLWRYQTTLHARLSLPFRCFLMILLAAPLGIVTARRGVLGGVAMSVGLFVMVYFTYTIGLRMGERGRLSPALGAWGVLGVFFILGAVMLYMKNFGLTYPSFSNWLARRRRLAAQKLKSV
jgi:lipopolysaccharide export LptBFGC system permease protein LptF